MQAAITPDPKRVLLADDNRDATAVMSLGLEQQGYEVAVAHDGLHAVQLARAFRPAAAIVDLDMPGLDGFELARLLKEGHPSIALIAWSGAAEWSVQDRLAGAGFDTFLAKPAALRDVLAALQRRAADPAAAR